MKDLKKKDLSRLRWMAEFQLQTSAEVQGSKCVSMGDEFFVVSIAMVQYLTAELWIREAAVEL